MKQTLKERNAQLEKELTGKNRELEIEAALEKVRARTMAMYKSIDLLPVINVLSEQFQLLGFKVDIADFNTNYREKDWHLWLWAMGQVYPQQITVPYFDHPYFNKTRECLDKGFDFDTSVFTKEEKDTFQQHFYKVDGVQSSEEEKQLIESAKGFAWSIVFFKNTSVTIANFDAEPYSEEQNSILRRFGNIFEQTYTRFLDLQKAEEQAREAQIQLALERVRARTMAMHSSEELKEVVRTLFEELTHLDANLQACLIATFDEATFDQKIWLIHFKTNDPYILLIPHNEQPFYLEMIKAWKERNHNWAYVLEGEAKIKWEGFLFSDTDFRLLPHAVKDGMQKPGKVFFAASYYNYGAIQVSSPEPFSKESIDILQRFSKVFDSSYTRFLDLQKAEAQAREAEIELGLERVRSKTMAMHNSKDVGDTVVTLFEELIKLGLNELDRCGIGIFTAPYVIEAWTASKTNEEKSELMIGHLDMKKHPLLQGTHESWENKKQTFQYILEGDDTINYFNFINNQPDYKGKRVIAALHDKLVFTCFFFKEGCLYTFSSKEISNEKIKIFNRFAGVFGQTYRRYLDLQKAEAQAREAEIELSLERVRAKAMALHKSADLIDVINVLADQFQHLGFKVHVANFNKNYQDKDWHLWLWALGRVYPHQITVPYFDHPYFNKLRESLDKGLDFNASVFTKDEKDSFQQHFYNIVGDESSEERKQFVFSTQGFAWSVVYLKNTSVTIANYDAQPYTNEQNSILRRFGNVFEQTYTRFLDLQKAEAQAEEARIESALEKVRSTSLAMHKSEELQLVVNALEEKFKELGMEMDPADSVSIGVYKKGIKDFEYWIAGPYQPRTSGYRIPHGETPMLKEVFLARESDAGSLCKVFSYEEKKESFKYFFDHTELKYIPAERKKFILAAEACSVAVAFSKHSWIQIVHHSKKLFNEERLEKLKRFARVFDQAYVRFLDLQKAEAQTRESQIQLALERVRARTMAMFKSDELAETTRVLFTEFKELNVLTDIGIPDRAFISIVNENKGVIEFWITSIDGSQINRKFEGSIKEPIVFSKAYKAWKKQEKSLVVDVSGNDLIKYLDYLKSIDFPVNEELYELHRVNTVAFFSKGFIGITSLTLLQQESIQMMERFAGVFDITYTRFLDLQKAEAQAREAEIELALERVRARTMAMQKSDELSETVYILFQQFRKLGEIPDQATIGIINEQEHVIEYWVTMYGNQVNKVFKFSIDEPNVTNKIYRAWKENKKSLVINLKGKELSEFMTYRAEKGGAAINPKEKRRIINVAFFSKGLLNVQSNEERSEESIKLLERFTAVFEQTYTRFLDLQKAEAQAREARIEMALEKVRAESMAMSKSEDLALVVSKVFNELGKLEVKALRCGIGIINGATRIVNTWVTTSTNVGSNMDISGDEPLSGHPLLNNIFTKWQEQKSFSYILEGNDLLDYYKVVGNTDFQREFAKEVLSNSNARHFYHCVMFPAGGLFTFSETPFSEDTCRVLQRFADAFYHAYKRFEDLQKAEAQAREAEIELALERVRARTMAMQKSEELKEVIQLVYGQFIHLNINIEHTGFLIDYKERDDLHIWLADEHLLPSEVTIPWFDSIPNNSIKEAKEKGLDFFTYHLTFEEKNKFYQDLFKFVPGVPEETLEYYFNCPGLAGSGVLLENIGLYIENFSGSPYSDEETAVLMRFGKVFQQTYTRFLDLQKAEAQAREAQIEAALERVRGKAMAMQSSEELAALIGMVFTELTRLDLALTRCVIWIFNPETNGATWWMANSEDPQNPINCDLPYNPYEPYLVFLEQWQKRANKFQYELSGTIKKNWDDYLFSQTGLSRLPVVVIEGMKAPEHVFLTASFNNFGALNAATLEPLSDEHLDVLLRFAKVFDLTYTRFNDLKQAEAQAREATIEAALERVRGKAMAMHTSRDLTETIIVFYHEMELLSVTPRRCGVGLLNRESRIVELSTMNTTEEGNSIEIIGRLNMAGHPVLEGIYDNWLQQKEYQPVLRGNEIKEYYKLLRPQISYPDYPHDAVQFGYFFYFPEGGVYAWTNKELGEDELKIYRRFTSVLSLTYKRYKDLTDSEARAKEAIKQASLDRVRGEIASMRFTEDLQRITPLIFKELTALGVPFFRCGVFIINESENIVHIYLSAPDGHSLATLNLTFNSNELTANAVNYWRKGKVYHQHWNKEEFINWTKSMMEMGQVQNQQTYQGTVAPPETLDLHFVPFTQGMLYVGNLSQLNEDEIALVKSLAEAFSIAYARYEDFTKLEHAKENIENTLAELKATQKQLVQSEKMASLGELTAGIAHEIQNPLNFVNNFSDVNTELIDEAESEIDKGNMDETKSILKDIKENEQKINHHGKRAGDIVKGMLQHSRSSTGVKEPTDINALADEYLRLSYHGLRAKDKSFNAKMETNFDKTIGKINIIPQDIGRVLLNLLNNAFYAVNEQKSKNLISYQPTVSVATKKSENHVIITVSDNGNGIPQKIVDKIFQPFFTTKPTGQGTGLGLSLSYDIIKAHGGEIKVETKENKGTIFIIQLPVKSN